ncbi:MAG TPA: PP2C family protein-serine/threonine phosphatase [Candidatus Acidoferrales bacterium]|nr:PP2C family protein-serine/threonine phosphatase [Candidatus Acidoferrales bacterium]
MSTNPSAAGGERQPAVRRAGGGVRGFWQRVTEGIEISDLWAQFRAEARSSYGLYSREVDWEEVDKGRRWTRPFRAAWALFLAMLMKLSPTRRVLLLLAIVLMSTHVQERPGQTSTIFVELPNLGVVLLFLLLALELADRVTMKRDLEIAREIQRWLVPETPPEIPGYDIAFLSRAANTVAGDYYDTIPRGAARNAAAKDAKILLVVADVAGKSVPAAILMATFQASLRAVEATGTTLGELVQSLNFYVCENSRSGLRFITAFFAELETATGGIRYTSAGHHPALLRRAAGAVQDLAEGGLPLGIELDERFPEGQTSLRPGDILFIYTDGLVEAVNAQGEEFGKSRLSAVLSPCDGTHTAAEVLAQITRVVDGFVGAARQHDDITCMVVRRRPAVSA